MSGYINKFGIGSANDIRFGSGTPIVPAASAGGFGSSVFGAGPGVAPVAGWDLGSMGTVPGQVNATGSVLASTAVPGINPAKLTGMDKINGVLGGLQTIGGLWAAFQSAKMAKKQFNFTKKTTEANMANQIKSYNSALEDRARSRAVVESQDAATSQAYVDKNKLPAYRG